MPLLKKKVYDYFGAYSSQAGFAQEMALNLRSSLAAGELGTRPLMNAMHTIENDADHVNHFIQEHLETDLVVPLNRSSMCALAHGMDDVNDALENIAIKAYLFNCSKISIQGPKMFTLIAQAGRHLSSAAELMSDFRHNAKIIKEELMAIQNLESDCDRLYIESVHALYMDPDISDEMRRIQHAMLDAVEEAMDQMEKAAELIEGIVTENI